MGVGFQVDALGIVRAAAAATDEGPVDDMRCSQQRESGRVEAMQEAVALLSVAAVGGSKADWWRRSVVLRTGPANGDWACERETQA